MLCGAGEEIEHGGKAVVPANVTCFEQALWGVALEASQRVLQDDVEPAEKLGQGGAQKRSGALLGESLALEVIELQTPRVGEEALDVAGEMCQMEAN
jgi:hypothetical protein